MKNSFRKAASALLVFVLMAGMLTACGGTDDPSESGEETPEYVYVANFTPFAEETEINYVQSCCWSEGKLYFIASIITGSETETYVTSQTDLDGMPIEESYEYDTYRTALFSANEDGTGAAEMTGYVMPEVPEGRDGGVNVNNMIVDAQGNIWVYEQVYTYWYDLPEGYDETTDDMWEYYQYEDKNFIRRLDQNGAELASVDISYIKGEAEYFYINGFSVDGEGNLYLADGDGNVYVLDTTGQLLFEIEADGNYVNNMVTLADGSVAVVVYDETSGGYVMKSVDLEAKAYGESSAAPYNVWNFYPGAGEYDFYYNTGTSFFGYDIETETGTKLFSWIGSDVDSDYLGAIIPLADGRILCLSTDYSGETQKTELVTMVKTPYSETDQKTTLTYACMYLDYNIRSQIIKFNKTNSEYRIEVIDYSEYNTSEDYTAGLTKLTTEIISGKVPDILDTSNLPIRQYAAKGLLEDLWPYIEADTELGGRGALVSSVFDALEQEGKLYQIAPSFSVYTVAGASSVVGDEPGWTLDELYAAFETMPEGATIFGQGIVRETIMYYCCALGMDDFVNWETGECKFDSQEFINILQFASTFPETYDWENEEYVDETVSVMSGMQMLSIFYAYDFDYYQMYKAMYGGDVTFIGFPTESENGNAFMVERGLAMSAKCEDKDGVWQFMRTLLTEEYQESNVWDFPTNKNVFDQKLEEAMTPIYYTDPETGEQVEQSRGSWGWDSLTVEMYALTQEEADQFMDLIESTNRIYNYDEAIMAIINEEAAAFFAGQNSAEDTAQMIQSRVSLYVNEQR